MSGTQEFELNFARKKVSYQDIYDMIDQTNNGVLMLKNLNRWEKLIAEEMKKEKLLVAAMFLSRADSVKRP